MGSAARPLGVEGRDGAESLVPEWRPDTRPLGTGEFERRTLGTEGKYGTWSAETGRMGGGFVAGLPVTEWKPGARREIVTEEESGAPRPGTGKRPGKEFLVTG